MLDVLRKKRRSLILLLAFAVIIIVFIFSFGVGPGPQDSSRQDVVATVDGVPISSEEFTGLYQRQLDFYRNTFKDQFTDEFLESLDLQRKVLDTLVRRLLLLNEAHNQGVKVAETEVQNMIISQPTFHKDGSFDKELYFSILQRNRLSPAAYELAIEGDLLVKKMTDRVVGELTISEEELRDKYFLENRQIALEYIGLPEERFFAEVELTEEDARAYYEKNGAAFMVPTRVKVFHGYLDKDSLVGRVEVSEDAIKQYYEANRFDYEEPKQVKARHILIRATPGAGEGARQRDAALFKADEVLKSLRAGEDFAGLATKQSEDPGSAKRGGDLGWFGPGMMVKPFEKAAFSLKKGETSQLVETEYGFHIIRVDDIKESKITTLKEATPEIRRTLAMDEALREGRSIMASLHEVIKGAGNDPGAVAKLREECELRGVKASETEPFFRTEPDVELSKDAKLLDTAFMLAEGDASGILDTERGFYIIKVLERVDEHVPPYEDVAGEVKVALRKVKARDRALEKAVEVIKVLGDDKDKSMRALAKKEGLDSGKTEPFGVKEGVVPGLGVYVADRLELFKLKKDAPYYNEPVMHKDAFYVFKLKSAKEAGEDGFTAAKENLREALLKKKEQETFDAWIEGLREKAEIEENEFYF